MIRVARVVGACVLTLLGVIALLVGTTWTVLRTDRGGEFVRRLALPRINALIVGDLQLGRFRFGADRLTLEDVVLRGADAEVVAHVRRIVVAFSPLVLLRGRLAIESVAIQSPALFLRTDAAGSNIARALARRQPGQAGPGSSEAASGDLAFDLGRLRVSDGRVEFAQGAAERASTAVRASGITIEATAHVEQGARVFSGDARVSAALTEPLQAPLLVHLSGQGRQGRREAALSTALGDSTVEATVLETGRRPVTTGEMHAHVTPALMRALAPAVGLRIPLDLTAQARREEAAVTFSAALGGAAGTVTARGAFDAAEMRAHAVHLRAEGIDLGRALEGFPASDLSLGAALEGGGASLRSLTGTVAVEVQQGRLDTAVVGPLTLRLKVEPGSYQLERLRLVLPGLVVTGKGLAGPERVAAVVDIVAADLAHAAGALRGFPGLDLPEIAGKGRVSLSVLGTMRSPEVRASASFARLVVDRNRVQRLALDVRVPDLHAPEVARIDLRAESARVSGRDLGAVRVHAQSLTSHLTADAQIGAPTPVRLHVGGTWGRHRESFSLERFGLRLAGADWKLERVAHVDLRPTHLAVAGLALRAGDQLVRADLEKRGERLRAHILLKRLDLGALARQVAPHVPLAGSLDLEVAVAGTTGNPTAVASAALRGGRFGRYRDLALRLDDGRYGRGRASGDVTAQGLGTSLHAAFDVPAEWPPRDHHAPLELVLTMPETELSVFRDVFDAPVARRFGGKVGLSVRVSGSASAPALRLDTSARGLTFDGHALGDVSIHAAGDAATPLGVALAFRAPRPPVSSAEGAEGRGQPLVGVGSFNLRTGLALSAFTRRPPTLAELMAARFDLSGDLRDVPLEVLALLGEKPLVTGGTASLRVSAHGPASAPTGALNIQVFKATEPRVPPTDARLDASFGERDARLALRVLRGPTLLLSASGTLGLASRQLRDHAALVKAPLSLRASLGPLRFRREEIPGATGIGVSGALTGDVSAAVALDGTLERPVVEVTAAVKNTRLGSQPLGAARASVTYASRALDASVAVATPGGGDLNVKAHGGVDLGFAALARGVDAAQIPMDVSLTARRFELAWLSDLSTKVRKVSGQLSATVRARGVMAKPRISGQLSLVNGGLTLTGLGVYRDIQLTAHGDESSVWIDDLRLASGSGTARLTAQASRDARRGYTIESSAHLQRFPIYGQGQLLAGVSADTHLAGEMSSANASLAVRISEAHVELTDAKLKNLQPLGRPPDVILMDGDRPRDRAEAVKLNAAMAEMKEATTPALPNAPLPSPPSAFRVQLAVDAPRNLWINGKDAALELGLAPGFRVEGGGSARIYGRVLVRRGRIDVLGRRFDLQAGSVIRFIGPVDGARLDVSAKYFNETENVGVILTAKGPLDHLAIAVSSPERPDLTQGQLYTLIVTGRLQLGGNSAGSASASGEAASLVGGLVAAQLQKTLAKKLPLDVLTLQAGQGLTGSRLEAGTYLTRKLYAGYVGRVGANPALLQNRNAVHLEYQLSRRWSFDGEYGDVGTGTADLMWTKHY